MGVIKDLLEYSEVSKSNDIWPIYLSTWLDNHPEYQKTVPIKSDSDRSKSRTFEVHEPLTY